MRRIMFSLVLAFIGAVSASGQTKVIDFKGLQIGMSIQDVNNYIKEGKARVISVEYVDGSSKVVKPDSLDSTVTKVSLLPVARNLGCVVVGEEKKCEDFQSVDVSFCFGRLYQITVTSDDLFASQIETWGRIAMAGITSKIGEPDPKSVKINEDLFAWARTWDEWDAHSLAQWSGKNQYGNEVTKISAFITAYALSSKYDYVNKSDYKSYTQYNAQFTIEDVNPDSLKKFNKLVEDAREAKRKKEEWERTHPKVESGF